MLFPQAMAPFINIHFLGSSLTFMMVYIWSQRNQHIRVIFFFLPFPAPYLPWVLLGASALVLTGRYGVAWRGVTWRELSWRKLAWPSVVVCPPVWLADGQVLIAIVVAEHCGHLHRARGRGVLNICVGLAGDLCVDGTLGLAA